ncbi:MAG: TldD/PmbA family protein [Fidelibacterota bacterium]
MILTERESKEVGERILALSSSDEVRVNLYGGRSGNTRFALNSITTSGEEDTLSVQVTSYFGSRHATSSGTEIDDESLKRIVESAETAARFSPEDPEYVPELGPQDYLDIDTFFATTARATPRLRIRGAESAIEPSLRENLESAGFFEHGYAFSAVMNNRGLFAYARTTNASFSVTVRTPDGTGSGWASDGSRNVRKVDYRDTSRRAIQKAAASRDPKTLEPGSYPVILEPQAVADFIRFAGFSMNARYADEGRSFFSKPGGGNKIGEKVAGENITLMSDPTHPELLGRPFWSDGLPARKHVWIENGILKQLFYDRYWAREKGKEPTGFPSNMALKGEDGTLEDLIRDTDRAVLVTRFWYIRFVDPQTILLTGLTRDGTFWVENGEIQYAIKNFRFNESPVAMLNHVTGMTRPERAGGMLVPAIRASQFTFSSLSEAV